MAGDKAIERNATVEATEYFIKGIATLKDIGYPDKKFVCSNDREILFNHFRGEHKDLYDHYDDELNLIPGHIFSMGRMYSQSTNPHRGFSNIHAFTGISQ